MSSRLSEKSIRDEKISKYISCFSELHSESNKLEFHCRIENCSTKYYDKSGAIRHLKTRHKPIYGLVSDNKKIQTSGSSDCILERRVAVNVGDIWNGCVEMITQNALPFTFVQTSGFQKIIRPYVIALARNGIDLNITTREIKKCIEKRTKQIKELIRAEVAKKTVCLMIDIATKYNRSLLGINISYHLNDQLRVRTIGMHTMHLSHTAVHIVEIIQEHLKEYNIEAEQVIAVTTDNGKNLIKAIALLEAAMQNDQNPDPQPPLIAGLEDSEESCSESENEEILDIFGEEYHSDVLALVRLAFSHCHHDLINGVSCACHCLHLVVTYAIKQAADFSCLLDRAREVCKKLRTPTFKQKIKDVNLNYAILDVETRWNSTYLMVGVIDHFFLNFQ